MAELFLARCHRLRDPAIEQLLMFADMTKISPASIVKLASKTPIELFDRARISCLLQPWRTSSSAACGCSPRMLKALLMEICLANVMGLRVVD